jgi:N-carbamoyl-L-amino-acid hydrolase
MLEGAKIDEMAAVDGVRLVDAMAGAGFDAHRAPDARVPAGVVGAYVELHIEQGARLEEAGIPIGVVETIVGVRRARVIFVGQADHAGTTPMDRRRDAFLASADYALRVREHVVTRGGKASVTNFGVVRVHPGASNIVPGRADLVHEMRDPDVAVLERLAANCSPCAQSRAAPGRRGVGRCRRDPGAVSPRIRRRPREVCATLGRTSACTPRPDTAAPGARHDAGMIFIPSWAAQPSRGQR